METNNIIKIDNKQINKSITITLKNYQYEITNNQAKIIKYEGENQNEIKIPSYINYRNQIIIVNEILEGAFKDHNEIEKITIPNTIKSIHSYSFFMLSNLKLIYLPSSICFIEKNSFFLCQSLILISNLLEQPITYENNK